MANSDQRRKSPGPTARPLCKKGYWADFSALLPTTATHFGARCSTESYMNYSVANAFCLHLLLFSLSVVMRVDSRRTYELSKYSHRTGRQSRHRYDEDRKS